MTKNHNEDSVKNYIKLVKHHIVKIDTTNFDSVEVSIIPYNTNKKVSKSYYLLDNKFKSYDFLCHQDIAFHQDTIFLSFRKGSCVMTTDSNFVTISKYKNNGFTRIGYGTHFIVIGNIKTNEVYYMFDYMHYVKNDTVYLDKEGTCGDYLYTCFMQEYLNSKYEIHHSEIRKTLMDSIEKKYLEFAKSVPTQDTTLIIHNYKCSDLGKSILKSLEKPFKEKRGCEFGRWYE